MKATDRRIVEYKSLIFLHIFITNIIDVFEKYAPFCAKSDLFGQPRMFRQYKVWLDCSGDGNVVLSELFYMITIIPFFARIAKKGNDECLPVRKKMRYLFQMVLVDDIGNLIKRLRSRDISHSRTRVPDGRSLHLDF